MTAAEDDVGAAAATADGAAASSSYTYEITGSAAHSRIVPLLPPDWVDCSPSAQNAEADAESAHVAPLNGQGVDFLWSNSASRSATKPYRDTVRAYSHLPNGTAILDDKWALARLLSSSSGDGENEDEGEGGLESHCFRGPDGFAMFCKRVSMFAAADEAENDFIIELQQSQQKHAYPELIRSRHVDACVLPPPPAPANLWVIKDAQSNGAGGIWVVDRTNAPSFLPPASSTPLISNHRYVAQRYAWPPVLYHGRKFHIRVYGLITADGKAYVHNRCFLHVANEQFAYGRGRKSDDYDDGGGDFNPSVHITNCCANSHDATKFSGEICADLGRCMPTDYDATGDDDYTGTSAETAAPLGDYLPSISATVATLASKSLPYLAGGSANGGFEYLGMDFILSPNGVAHLLEINAPPSQDTATGLDHAERLHDEVIGDLLKLWVLPRVESGRYASNAGGWRCVYESENENEHLDNGTDDEMTVPSKAAIVNKMRWSVFEWKMAKKYEEEGSRLRSLRDHKPRLERIRRVREAFPYFDSDEQGQSRKIFVENAGGTQVPFVVIDAMTASLRNRHRDVEGSRAKQAARDTLLSILGASPANHHLFLGPNATSLLDMLAQKYIRSGYLRAGDKIVVSTENHLANVTPWELLATATGAAIVWWKPTDDLASLVTERTRIVAISHASNIVGEIRDIASICRSVGESSGGMAHVVVDGVAAAPHVHADLSQTGAHFYAVSCHKLFGPHMGALCSLRSAVDALEQDDSGSIDSLYRLWELGTANYEACAGVGYGLSQYVSFLSSLDTAKRKTGAVRPSSEINDAQSSYERTGEASPTNSMQANVSADMVISAYRAISHLERDASEYALSFLKKSDGVTVVQFAGDTADRIPIVGFFHKRIDADRIANVCFDEGIACRSDTFLAGPHLRNEIIRRGCVDGRIVRFSLVHYNTIEEAKRICKVLESIEGW